MSPKRNVPSSVLDDIRTAGTLMSNICFNLAQRDTIQEADRKSMKGAQIKWDAAIRRLVVRP